MVNRKGDIEIFMLGINIFFLLAVIILMTQAAKFEMHDKTEKIGTHSLATFSTYYVAEEMLLYIDTAASLAAIEASGKTIETGLTQRTDCGFYAGFPRWNSATQSCFPESVDSSYDRQFPREFQNNLNLPGLPRSVDYAIRSSTATGLTITALTDAGITLPILLAKGMEQRVVAPMVLNARQVQGTSIGFTPDARVPGITTVTTKNKYGRTGNPTKIVIHATVTDDLQSARTAYTEGLSSMHYVIGKDGQIVQFVPEDQVAYHLPECSEENVCVVENIQEESISIALVNPLSQEMYVDESAICQYGTLASPTQWCRESPYNKWGSCPNADSRQGCWANYTDKQRESLKKLVVDIVRRNEISVTTENILLKEQIKFSSNNPGPALSGSDPESWWARFQVQIAQDSAKPAEEDKEVYTAIQPIIIISPVETTYDNPVEISSCWGYRNLEGSRNFHDGIDIAVEEGTPVVSVSAGEIIRVCEGTMLNSLVGCSTHDACGGYGTNVLIKHADGYLTRYSHLSQLNVKEGDAVLQGEKIGLSGNTGCSTGAHLDFKIFTSEADANNRDKGKNPFCFFTEQQLQSFKRKPSAVSCEKFVDGTERFSHANDALNDPRLGGCEGITPGIAGSACGVSMFRSEIGGNKKLEDTKSRLEESNLLGQVAQIASEEGVDARLLLALIAQESRGKIDAVNNYGFVGLGQIGATTAQDVSSGLNEVFESGIKPNCKCTSGVCSGSTMDVCIGDPRLDPVKNIRGTARYLKWNIDFYDEFDDPVGLGVAAYNAGVGTIQNAARGVASKQNIDPRKVTLQNLLATIDYDVVRGSLGITDQEQNKAKQEEIKKYAPEVLSMFVDQGGSLESAYSDVECKMGTIPVTVKDVGSFTFTPNFKVNTVNRLRNANLLVLDIRQAVNRCKGQGDNEKCIMEQIDGKTIRGFSFQECSNATNGLYEMTIDCKNNGQENCYCEWSDIDDEMDFTVKIYGETPHVEVNGRADMPLPAEAWLGKYRETSDGEVREVPLEIIYDKKEGQYFLIPYVQDNTEGQEYSWKRPDKDDYIPFQYDGGVLNDITVFKNGSEIVWQPIINPDMDKMCAPVKNNFLFCGTSDEKMLVDGEWVFPELRFAVYLEDTHPAEQVFNPMVVSQGGHSGLCFFRSPSEGISYYKIACALGTEPPSDEWFNENYVIEHGRDGQDRPLNELFKISSPHDECEVSDGNVVPLSVTDTPVTYRVVPYDKSGLEGQEVVVSSQSEQELWAQMLGVSWVGQLEQLGLACESQIGGDFVVTG